MRSILIIGLMLCLCSCQEQHEKAIEDYIQKNFNDPQSYECVEIGKVQEETVILYAMEQVRARGKAEGWTADSIFNKTMELRPFLEEQGEDPDKVLFRYVDHTYRANNALGAKMLHNERWYFNEDLTSVVRIETK